MGIVFLLLKQNFVMLIYLLIGYALYKKKLVTKAGSGDMGKLLLYVIMPMAITKSFLKEFSKEAVIGYLISFVAALLSLILAIIISRIVFGKKDVIEHFGASFSNAGFIGIPLVQMVLGEEAVFYVSSFVALLNILQWTYGIYIMTDNKDAIRFKKIITNPIVISFIIGLLLFFLPIKLPVVITGMMGTMASMNGPLAMIVLGVYLAQISFKQLFTDKAVYKCSVVRLLVIPVLTMILLSILPQEYLTIKLTILIAAAAPVGSNLAIFAQIHEKDYTQAVKDVCLSTLLCITTMPIILGIAHYIW